MHKLHERSLAEMYAGASEDPEVKRLLAVDIILPLDREQVDSPLVPVNQMLSGQDGDTLDIPLP